MGSRHTDAQFPINATGAYTLLLMSSVTHGTTLPVIVDTPTATPSLGFENYVSGVSAAIMGGQPARYTVGLYGPWGSGKSSLLAAIRRELHAWPHPPTVTAQYSRFVPTPEAPIVVDFDAWRYADKGSLLVSMLLRIQAAVQQRTDSASNQPGGQKKFQKALKVLTTVLQGIEVSAWGVTVAANSSAGTVPPSGDLAATLMPFEHLGEIGNALPDEQRIVVLVDDLDRCSPAGVVNVIEAIHVLTDITGVVFVLALDYEYLTSAILSAYPTTDPDRFIEKIVQVPFHVPAPKIADAEMEDIIPTWSAIEPWLSNVELEDVRAIMRIGLRSNPRQIKRLFNTFLLFAHMNGVRQGTGSAPDSTLDNALALKVLGLQVAWPAAFAELLRELASEFGKSSEGPADWDAVGKLDSYSGWHAGESLHAGVDHEQTQDEDKADREHSKKGAGSKHSKPEGTRHYTQESLERLRAYLHEVLTELTPPRDIWKIMVMAQDLTQNETEEPDAGNAETTRLKETLSNASQHVRDRYTEVVTFLAQLDEDNSLERPQYFRISRSRNGKTRVFGQLTIRPTQHSMRLAVTFGTAELEAVEGQNFPDKLHINHKSPESSVDGVYVIRDVQIPGVNHDVQRILRFAHEHVKP